MEHRASPRSSHAFLLGPKMSFPLGLHSLGSCSVTSIQPPENCVMPDGQVPPLYVIRSGRAAPPSCDGNVANAFTPAAV